MSQLIKQVVHDLKRHEGCRLKAYKCTAGVWTIGYGHTKGVKEGDTCTQAQAEAWLEEDLQKSVDIAKRVVRNYNDLNAVRKGVLINMAFNLGETRLRQFKRTLATIESGQFATAAVQMLESLWARQVGQRATELAARMSSGKIPDHRLYKES